MWSAIDDRLLSRFRAAVKDRVTDVELAVRAGRVTPTAAAEQLLASARTERRAPDHPGRRRNRITRRRRARRDGTGPVGACPVRVVDGWAREPSSSVLDVLV